MTTASSASYAGYAILFYILAQSDDLILTLLVLLATLARVPAKRVSRDERMGAAPNPGFVERRLDHAREFAAYADRITSRHAAVIAGVAIFVLAVSVLTDRSLHSQQPQVAQALAELRWPVFGLCTAILGVVAAMRRTNQLKLWLIAALIGSSQVYVGYKFAEFEAWNPDFEGWIHSAYMLGVVTIPWLVTWLLRTLLLLAITGGSVAGYVYAWSSNDIEEPVSPILFMMAFEVILWSTVVGELYYRQARSLFIAQLEERRRLRAEIARDLHDEVGQIFAALHFEIYIAKNQLEPAHQARQSLERLDQLVAEAAVSLRAIVTELRVRAGLERDVVEILRDGVRDWSTRYGLHSDFHAPVHGLTVSPAVSATLYRIAQECATNAARHARASRLDIELDLSDAGIAMTIRDDGVGLDEVEPKNRGFGLRGIRERAQELGGTCKIESAKRQGTVIRIDIPLEGSPAP